MSATHADHGAGFTMTEKMLARASGSSSVRAGEFVSPDPEAVIIHDGYVSVAHKELTEAGYRRITNRERVIFVTDHDVIYTSPAFVLRGANIRRVAKEWQVGNFFDVGQGGHGHIYPMEAGLVRPGSFVFSYDPHCSTFGALGAYASCVLTDISVVLATGTLAIEVPQTLRITLAGQFASGVHPRDLGFKLARGLTSGAFDAPYDCRVVEFSGETARRLPVPSRVAICNTLTEIGTSHVLFSPKTMSNEPVTELAHLEGDDDARYESDIAFDIDSLCPQVALPGSPDRAVNVQDAQGPAITHAYIGSCGSNMYEDIRDAAALMRGRRVASGVRLFVVPGTVKMAERLTTEGVMQQLMDAGAIILPSSCGPCAGGRSAPVGPKEVSISTAATNNPGRMGDWTAELYLGSPVTVAASAITGRITDPRTILGDMNVRRETAHA